MKKLFVNEYEEITNKILCSKSIEHDVHVYSKIRLADVFNVEYDVTEKDLFNYALKSHFDFVVYDKRYLPLFVVEVDGIFHRTNQRQRANDCMKNELCKKYELPLLRINSNHLVKRFRNTSLLDWMVDLWFAREAFFEAQRSGSVPMDEIFDPYSVFYDFGKKKYRPYDLTYELQKQITQKFKDGKLLHYHPNIWIGIDSNLNYHGLACLKVTQQEGIVVNSAIHSTTFPIVESNLLEQIITYEIYEKFLNNQYNLASIKELDRKYKEYINKYQLRIFSGLSIGDNNV